MEEEARRSYLKVKVNGSGENGGWGITPYVRKSLWFAMIVIPMMTTFPFTVLCPVCRQRIDVIVKQF